MRNTALVALLPFLGGIPIATARPTEHTSSKSISTSSIRKSLNFGPSHPHASFELLETPDVALTARSFDDVIDIKAVAKRFLSDRVGVEGESFYLRDDTYTDKRTGVTHIYARQLLNGLEVSDGDININIDRSGNIISWGNSFHPGSASASASATSTSSGNAHACSLLKDHLFAHKSELVSVQGEQGPWGLVKSAAQVVLPFLPKSKVIDQEQVDKIQKNINHVEHHIEALCDNSNVEQPDLAEAPFYSPSEALVSLIQRIQSEGNVAGNDVSADDLEYYPDHSLAPKPAPAEPPTQIISGSGLGKAGIKAHVPARLMYTQTSEGDPRQVWKLEVEMESNWYEAYIDIMSGDILRIVDWAKDYSWEVPKVETMNKGHKQHPLPIPAPPPKVPSGEKLKPYTYQVFPWGTNDPKMGNMTMVTEPWDIVASPMGWHEFPTIANPWSSKIPGMNVTGNSTIFETTIGNNVIAHEDWEGQSNYLLNYRPLNENLTFVYEYGEPDGLAPKEYIDFVVTQLFYTSNMYHDLTYRLGFDEVAGNFQAYNFEKGGNGGDPVIANAQDGSGTNNANFMTPPDGTSGRMRMYVWDTATPWRDGDIEAGIIIHELSHGLSTRLTGGPMNSGCLGFGEAGGMGEGWGDALATLIRQIEEHDAFVNGTDTYSMGAWAANRDTGIRNYKYSTNTTVNPSTYKTLDKPGYWGVHAIGEVWAEFLFIMSQRLIEKYGFSSTLFPPLNTSEPNDYYTKTTEESIDSKGQPVPLVPKHGNTLAIQLIIDGMKLQPCRPSFFDARDAIIQADQILTGGDNACLIWKAFAERGLGMDAQVVGKTPWGGGIRTDGHDIPLKVCGGGKKHKGGHKGDDEE